MSGYVSLGLMRQNYSEEVEKMVNDQINLELKAFYTYLSMSCYFNRADVALPNFAKYFKKSADEEYGHAQIFMKHQNERGGKVVLKAIPQPSKNEWGTGLEAFYAALELEKEVNAALIVLHTECDKHNDYHSSDFIDGKFLGEQVEAIKELTSHICNLNRVGKTGHGEYHFERESLED